MIAKNCPRCKKDKQLNHFHNCSKYKDGKQIYCIECRRILVRENKIKRYHSDEVYRNKLKKYNQKLRKTQKYKNRMNAYFLNKKQTDVQYKVSCNLRTRMWQVLKGINKSANTLKLLGCSLEEFKKHIESKFQEGMSWENYSRNGWHIDHIIPCDKFDLTIKEQQERCFHYTNLQPLWAHDNLRKNNKIIS